MNSTGMSSELSERLIANASTQHSGQKTAVLRGEILNDRNELVATATGTFMFLPVDAEDVEETIPE